LTKTETMKPDHISSNLVMVRPEAHMNKIGEWQIFDIHSPAHHHSVRGRVVKVPDNLYCAGDQIRKLDRVQRCDEVIKNKQFIATRSLEFGTKMELEIGDEVIFRYIIHTECMSQGWYWYEEGEEVPCLFMPYDSIFMIIRDGKRIMVNGWLWVEPVQVSKDEVANDVGMIIAEQGKKKIGSGIVRLAGSCNSSYLYEAGSDLDDVKVGDSVVFKKTAGVGVEWFCHQSLNSGRYPYYVMQRKDILAII